MSRKRNACTMASWVGAREASARERRVRVAMPAPIQVAAERTVEARIADLSLNGFRVVSDEPLQVGQSIKLHGRKDRGQGEIRWVDGLEAGGVFHRRPPDGP
jgi:hypothetical protein